ncbi:KAP family P-loop NTPase fold protein [Vibrio splendidus]|uniref:KAP family P-loop NTPase fold protein n=1 Tax=Vibrio splendidus TaxID=29497 RepID=UPI000C843A04|nr:P-loop NTPase fold protein [Vibrio splendidus]PMK09450.1 NTPase KAP [Vibrio splendidus]
MSQNIKLDWSEGLKVNNVFFPEDKLDRAKYATFLTKLLASQGYDKAREEDEQKQNYVLNLNSEWGSGKTYFLKRWSEDVKEFYPTVYIDAWQKDYSDDPLMTVIASIIEQLREQAGKDKDAPEFKVPRKLIGLLKSAAPGIARGLFKRYVGIDPTMIMNAEDDNEDIGEITDEDGKPIDMSFAASEVVKNLIDEHDAKSAAIESLKKSVFKWVEAVVGLKKKSLPAFIFIDELDRCRPSYAVEMLETIKHIFNIEGIVFVVATDTEQLQHAVKAVYGEGFNAKIYLSRFFNSRYSLKSPNLENFLEVHCDSSKLSGASFRDLNIEVLPFNDDANTTLKNISILLDSLKVSARTAIQITDRIIATISNMPSGSKVDILMLATLLCIQEKDSSLFDEIVSGTFEREKIKGDDVKKIYLDTFFESYISKRSQYRLLEMNFNPQELVPHYSTYSRQRPTSNPYKEGCYQIALIEYLKEIFAPHFDSASTSARPTIWMGQRSTPTAEQKPTEKIFKDLLTLYSNIPSNSDKIMYESTVLWLKFFYLENKFQTIDIDEYKDFVELASPLDWMGQEELPEID